MNLSLVFLALAILTAIFGAYFGSFCSKVIFRLENRRMNIRSLAAASICPNCLKKISFKDKIPIVSYLLLGGKCRNCQAPITRRYLVLEVIGMILPFILVYFKNFDVIALLDYFFVMTVICDFYISYDEYEFPLPLSFFILILSVIKAEFNLELTLQMLLCLVVSAGLAYLSYTLVCKKDRKLSTIFYGAVGSYLGLVGSIFTLVCFLIITLGRKFFKVNIRANLILVILTIIDFAFSNIIEESVLELITFIIS